jgi:hypothetical protein
VTTSLDSEPIHAKATATTWRRQVAERPVIGALVAGFVAMQIATVTGYWYSGINLKNLDWPAFNGALILPNLGPGAQFVAGAVFHGLTAIAFAIVYALLIHPLLPFPNTTAGNLIKALIFGLFLGTLSAMWWVPQLFPALHAGFFSNNLGWKIVFGIYLWHVIWAVNLGAIYNPSDD